MASRTGVASRARSFTRRTASSSASRPTVSRLGWRLRDQPLVGRELALDQHGGEAGAADLEAGLALAEAHGERVAAGEHPGQLLQRPGRHEHVLALGEHRGAGQVADGEPVGVGGHQAQAAGLGGQEHAGEDRPGVVAATRPGTTWRQRGGQLGAGEGDRLAGGLGEAGELVGRAAPAG